MTIRIRYKYDIDSSYADIFSVQTSDNKIRIIMIHHNDNSIAMMGDLNTGVTGEDDLAYLFRKYQYIEKCRGEKSLQFYRTISNTIFTNDFTKQIQNSFWVTLHRI